jgi:hypothetical protein
MGDPCVMAFGYPKLRARAQSPMRGANRPVLRLRQNGGM